MIMTITAAMPTPTAITNVCWCSCPSDSAGLAVDVGEEDCTCDVMAGTSVVVWDMICVDISEAVSVDVNKAFVVTSEQEVADGSYPGILSNDPT